MSHEPFRITFGPVQEAVKLLAQVANPALVSPSACDATSPHQKQAQDALESWRQSLATPAQTPPALAQAQDAVLNTDDDLEVDDAGACISESENGFFIQTWTWRAADARAADTSRHIGLLCSPIRHRLACSPARLASRPN